ncbi:unnamed protein product [Psylliodes chrysocephalus]|uniref:C-type lectin domain-containing protein n=1 Tax=Psylliodes chrysocephalus TaxID=3402493 RepID=A0A9P0CQZ1_9CUCU|nr:unnamed protein product [Psylliodes chrysocephala]
MKSFLAISCVFICFTTIFAFPKNDTQLRSHTFKLGEKSYLIDFHEITFNEAVEFCKNNNLQLVSIESAAENDKISEQLRSMGSLYTALWTSGTRLAASSQWIWLSTNNAITTFFWNNPPDYKHDNEYCLAIFPETYNAVNYWLNEDCTVINYPLCQSVPSN